MYLKEIKSYGFKSFADRINIELGSNLNAIVGPNGSGKSNVVDAVRWVLGEQSNKSLRAESNSDVIFSGSKSRKPLNSASVTLVFDNTDRHFPIDYNEVAIKRVAYRTGENEYYLNNEHCRLKDINNLLLDTGIAKESFNIISQGKIDEILSSKPHERRIIFEEAAGVLKYKKRKEEALRKLDKTNNNLKRVTDIIFEIEGNLAPLKDQSTKALEHLELKEKLKDIEVALMTNDIEVFDFEYNELKLKIEKLEDEITALNKNNINYDIDVMKEKDKLKEIESLIETKQESLINIVSNIGKIDAEIRLLKERKKYSNEDNQIEEKIVTLKENKLKIDNDLNNLDNLIELNNQKIVNLDSLIEKNKVTYLELKNKKENNYINLEKTKKNIMDLKHKISYLEDVIENNGSLPSSIKNILNNTKFSGIHNVVGKLFEVEDKYSLAIATALASSSNYLVVDDTTIAKKLIGYLKDNNLGRATFYPLNVIKEKYIDSNTLNILSSTREYLGLANTLIKYDEKYHNIMSNLLGNTIVIEDIDNATRIGKLIGNKYRIITLDGQVINVGGSLTGGSSYKVNNVIKEKHELLKNKQLLDSNIASEKELENNYHKLISELSLCEETNNNLVKEKNNILESINNNKNIQLELSSKKINIEQEILALDNITNKKTDDFESSLLTKLYQEKEMKNNLEAEIASYNINKQKIKDSIEEIENINKQSSLYLNKKEKELNNHKINFNRLEVKIDNLLLSLTEEYNLTFDIAKKNYHLDIEEKLARSLVGEYKNRLNEIGVVNLGAVDEYKRINERYEFLNTQKEDLIKAEDTLMQIIDEMDEIMIDKFQTTFNAIKEEFSKVFKDLFKGGYAEISLTDPDNLLETGVEIKAEPPGKKLQSISLLSGGEKTFTAISLLFAILNVRPVPFCLLDEVEAALDEANVDNFGKYLSNYNNITQIILITHKKKTMEYVDVLYGMTMQESGVSKLVSVKLEDKKKNE